MKYPKSYCYFNEKISMKVIVLVNWETILEIKNQRRFWKYYIARKNYSCLICSNCMNKGEKYYKFFKKGLPILYFCVKCFITYENENRSKF